MPLASPSGLTGTYGSPSAPLAFIIFTSAPGYSGLLKPLCAQFIWKHGGDFRIGWVATGSNDRENSREEIGEHVGCVRLIEGDGDPEVGGVRVGWDRFVLVGPAADPAGLGKGGDETGVREALRRVLHPSAEADASWKYLSPGVGSPSCALEQLLLKHLELDTKTPRMERHHLPPLPFLRHVSTSHAYALVQRSDFLTAGRDGLVANLRVYAEGGRELLCPIYASVTVPHDRVREESVGDRLAGRFVEWLGEEPAQGIWSGYGRVWEIGLPLFTRRDREEVAVEEGFVGKAW